MLKWNDGTTEEIEGTYVTEGTHPAGSMWAMNPLPQAPTDDFPPPCKAGTSPPVRAPMAVGKYGTNPGPCAGNWPTTVTILDTVRVPATLPPGEWTLSWRWECVPHDSNLRVLLPAYVRAASYITRSLARVPPPAYCYIGLDAGLTPTIPPDTHSCELTAQVWNACSDVTILPAA